MLSDRISLTDIVKYLSLQKIRKKDNDIELHVSSKLLSKFPCLIIWHPLDIIVLI